MRTSHEKPIMMSALEPECFIPSPSDRETWSIRILLVVLVLGEVIFVLVPGISSHLRAKIGFAPQVSVGFAILVVVLYLHLMSQRKLLSKVSTALNAATSYVNRLEQFSFLDPQTQLFNRKYLDQLFNQQLKWLNRSGKSVTLLLFEVLTEGQKTSVEQLVIEAALVLRSNFRGSDYVVRNSMVQYLVLLPDTTADEAQYALSRLANKLDDWNLEHQTAEMVLRHELSTCLPGGNLWETLRGTEKRLLDNCDVPFKVTECVETELKLLTARVAR
jgi:diguanylate cyclase (GGDEF)-like protein